ncbi:MAG: DUF488 domain-containing protein [Nitrospira sp.]|nr:DUF488 domain-containing protein [Nitrospira sp.]MCP9462231.1 DUF488 domain-containing protein [Nitrospira sp.]MCP9474734.1 DUF488 domain-containing protein [Nitrospira sp.]
MKVSIKRIYEPPAKSDGFRVLVDRLWPRGLSKETAHIDLWLCEIGPSTALRKWFNHDPARWAEFCRRYQAELKEKEDLLALLVKEAQTKPITLLYSAKDERHNQAVALQSFLLTHTCFAQPRVPPKTTAEISSEKKRRKPRSP